MFSPKIFSETYYWAGGGADNNWTTAANWRTLSESGTAATAYPTTGDTAFIAGNWTVTIDSDITVLQLNIQKSAASQYVSADWTTTLTGSGKITFGAMDFNRASATDGVIGTLEIDCGAECSGTLYTHSGTKLLIDSSRTLKVDSLTHTATNSIPKSLIQVDGTLDAASIDLQGAGNVGCNALKVNSGATVTAESIAWNNAAAYSNTDYSALDNAGTITLAANLSAKGPVVNSGTIESSGGSLDFSGTVANSGSIKTSSGGITFAGAVSGSGGTITSATGNVAASAAAASDLGTVQSSGGTFTNSGTGAVSVTEFIMGADSSIETSSSGALAISTLTGSYAASLKSDAGAISVFAYSSSPTIEVAANSSSVTLGAGSIGALTVNAGAAAAVSGALAINGDLENDGNLTASAALTIASDFTNTGTFLSASTVTSSGASPTFSGNAATIISDFVYAPSSVSGSGLSLLGDNTFDNFSCATAGAKITVNGAQTITGSLTLKGSAAQALSVQGSGSLNISSDQNSGEYLSVAWNGPSIGSGTYYYSAANSSFDASPFYGERNNWILLNDNMEFVWTGDTDTDWGTASNWNYNLIPGTDLEHSGVDTKSYPVTIPDSPSGDKFPTAGTGYTIKDLSIGQSLGSSASLTLASGGTVHNIAVTGTLLNYGTIYYTGTDRVTNGTDFINDTSRQGTVEFSSSGGASDLAAVQYYNLKINGSGVYSADGALAVANELYAIAGDLNLNNSSAATAASAASATFSTTGNVSLGNNSGDSFTVTGGALLLPSTLGSLSIAGTISSSGGITLSKDAQLNDDTNFSSATSLGSPINLTSASAKTVTTTAALTTSAVNTLTLTNVSLLNAAAVTGGNIIFQETALSPHQIFTPDPSSAYQSVTIDKTSGGEFTVNQALNAANFTVTKNGTLTTSDSVAATNFTIADNNVFVANATLAADNLSITKNLNAAFNALVTVTSSYADTANAGNIAFNSGCAFTPAATFTTTGTLTLDGTANACAFDGGLTHTAGETILSGELNSTNSAITLGTTTLSGDTNVNAASGEVAINGTLDGAYNFSSAGSGDLAFNGNVGSTAAPATITIDGATKVSALSITTTGLQLYKGDIDFNSNCSVTGTVQAAKSVATSAAYSVTFSDNLWLYTSAAATLGGNGGSVTVAKNIFFAGSGKTAAIESSVFAENILLLHGTLIANSSLSSTKDIVLLGPSYDIGDTKNSFDSQVAGLFSYNHASRKSAASYTDAFPTSCPDGTAISSSYTGEASVDSGVTIAAGQNFYANGLSILGSGIWTLALPDNDLQSSAFAEIYNSTITNCSASQKVSAAENNTATSCSNIITGRPLIKEAYTVYDDTIYISFVDSDGNDILIENSENEISAAVESVFNSAGAYASTYIDSDCQNSTDGAGDLAFFYIKAPSTWKTDANGISAGASESADRTGDDTCNVIPFLNIPKALSVLYETLRDSAKNRIAHYYSTTPDTSAASSAQGKTFTAVADKCAPVLTQVLTGQELHAAPGSQEPYDAHNFIEFVYSEPVDISGGFTSVLESDKNIQAGADLGASSNNSSGVAFAGLAATSDGKIDAALKTGGASPHALYRIFSRKAGEAASDQSARVRVSIAGYSDGDFDASNLNWPGYISSAATPTGTVTRISNDYIKDKSSAQNSLAANSTAGHPLPTLSVQNSQSELYGVWDVTPPSFAPARINKSHQWKKPAIDGSDEYEFVGASYGTGTLSAIELHWFDNEPTYSESLQWFSRAGWALAISSTEHSVIENYAADIRGGSRPGEESSNNTSGGIRFCTLRDANTSFKYEIVGSETSYGFSQGIQAGAESSLFTYAGSTSGISTHTTGAEDGLYCKLMLDQTNYPLQTTFVLTFDSTNCYVTDLAGNRIQCGSVKMKSIDRTPPDFNISAVPLGTKNMMIIFSKALNTDEIAIYNDSSNIQYVSALDYIPKSLELTSESGTGIQIDQNTAAKLLFKTNRSTGLLIALNQNAVLNDITSGVFVTAKSESVSYDPLAGINAATTYIQDEIGNYVVDQNKHAFSDFAVNAVQPQYAYDNSITDEGSATGFGLYQDGSWAVRDWNAEQANYGTLHAQKEVILQASLYDGTSDKSGGLLPDGHLASGNITGFFANHPDAASVSTKINESANMSWRIWLPNWTSDIFSTLASANNAACIDIDASNNDSGILFDIPKESADAWKSGDQISFLFKMGDYTVDHFGNGTKHPLYAVRLKNENDVTSLDLWSFKVKSTTLQRGGVTILNNVINVDYGENTVVQVDLKESGNLNVIVMTLDGNIVRYLRHGYTDAGTHYYNWNGANNSGSKVARGLYFVRVVGPGIDETRKVMCVK